MCLQERIAMLVSENHRLKARLAAREGEEQFFAFILNKPQDESYVRELQERLACVFMMIGRVFANNPL